MLLDLKDIKARQFLYENVRFLTLFVIYGFEGDFMGRVKRRWLMAVGGIVGGHLLEAVVERSSTCYCKLKLGF